MKYSVYFWTVGIGVSLVSIVLLCSSVIGFLSEPQQGGLVFTYIAITVAVLLYLLVTAFVYCSCFTVPDEESPENRVKAHLFAVAWAVFWPISITTVLYSFARYGVPVAHYSDPPDAEYGAENMQDGQHGYDGPTMHRQLQVAAEDRL